MYYLLLFVAVTSCLSFVAWRSPAPWPRLASAGAGRAPARDQGAAAADSPGSLFARLLKGEGKEDKPCLTPIDCVRTHRCAGHCGCR